MKNTVQYIDLSLPLNNQTPVYPGDPIVNISPVCTIDSDGMSLHSYQFSGHAGTHIDAQSHFIVGGKNIDEYPLEKFIGQGIVVDVRGCTVIDIDILKKVNLKKDMIVLFWSDYVKNVSEESYFQSHPVIGKTLAERLVNSGVKMIGIDAPSPDRAPYSIHKILLKSDILIIENLCNLDLVYKKKFTVYATPIKVPTDGVPVRVVASVE